MSDAEPSEAESDAAALDTIDAALSILRCPITLSPLRREGEELVAEAEPIRYPIRAGIPVLLSDEATPPEGTTIAALKEKYGRG